MSKPTIYIVEDNPIDLKLLEKFLHGLGYPSKSYTDSIAALDAFIQETPQIAILDWKMPDINGLEFCSQYRARVQKPYTYIILLTATKRTVETQDEVYWAGIDDFLTKPLNELDLRERLRVAERFQKLMQSTSRSDHNSLARIPNQRKILLSPKANGPAPYRARSCRYARNCSGERQI